ncbi:hypothetical protein TNCV_4701051 [Trichonephila clavipes]|nr:hypothetical protein TNCV_4701051 [Trichonephila clavipes]
MMIMCVHPQIMTDKEILEFVRSLKTISDVGSDFEYEMDNALFPITSRKWDAQQLFCVRPKVTEKRKIRDIWEILVA